MKPIIRSVKETLLIISILSICKKAAPNKPGIAKKNENLAASLWTIPNSKAVEIVMPDLEIPGIKANTCIIPINKTIDIVNLFIDLFGKKNVDINIKPLKNKAILTILGLKIDSIKPL